MATACNKCGTSKPESEFYASSPKTCKACVLARQKAAKDARTGGAPASAATRSDPQQEAHTESITPPPDRVADSHYCRPGGMGFSVQLEVDENTKATDIKITQYNASAEADQTVWLNQVEARDLQSWLADHMGKP